MRLRETGGSRAPRVGGTLAIVLCLLTVPTVAWAGGSLGPADVLVECSDAKDPCTLEPGTRSGSLVAGTDDVDHYTLSPPAGANVLTVSASFENVQGVGYGFFLELVDSQGVLRDRAVGTGAIEVATVGAPPGTWTLRVGFNDPRLLEIPPFYTGTDPAYESAYVRADYNLTLSSEDRDHVARLDGPGGPAPTVTASFEGQDARMDLYYAADSSLPGPNSWGHVITQRVDGLTTEGEREQYTASIASLLSRVPPGQTEVWTRGTVPSSVVEEVSFTPPAATSDEFIWLRATILSDPAEFSSLDVSLGAAWSQGIRSVHGWIAWDDAPDASAPEVRFPAGGTSTFAQLSDFEGDGTGVRAGPVSAAQGLHTQVEAPEGMAHTILVRADNIASHPPDPRFTVDIPNGTSVSLEGETRSWALDGTPSGTWTITMDERAGHDLGQMWVGAASFPLLPLSEPVQPSS